MTGRVLAGRYEILERIGEGASAEVFRARDHRLERIVAVKVLRPQYGKDEDARARFGIEARSAAALTLPNVVPVYDFGATEDGSLFIVMRLIEGSSLRQVLAERGPLTAVETVEIGRQVAHALAGAHAHGLVHRDVKPGNILIDSAGTAHLTDFGIVKALTAAADLTMTGVTFGTAAYLSPEQATAGPVGPRSDLYSLGVVLYEALAGRPPFSGDDPVSVSYRHAHEPPAPLSSVVPSVDGELEGLVMQSLEKDPQKRPVSAQYVAEVLGRIGVRLSSSGGEVAALAPIAAAAVGDSAEDTELFDQVTRPWPVQSAPVVPIAASQGYPPAPELGVAPPIRRSRERTHDSGDGASSGLLLALLGLGVFVVGTLVVLFLLAPRGNDGIGGLPTSSPTIPPPIITPEPPIPTPEPPPVTPEPPPVTPEPPPVTPEPPPITPEPPPITPEPPVVTDPPIVTEPPVITAPPPTDAPPPTPELQDLRAEIDDIAFTGDFHGDSNGTYHGRSASWVYGQLTEFHTMSADFQLDGQIEGPATLEIVGLDGENPAKNDMSVAVNGITIYQGPNPLPDDFCCGPSGPGNWGSALFEIPADVLFGTNTLVISNLEDSDCTLCPKYVMVDFAVVTYRARL